MHLIDANIATIDLFIDALTIILTTYYIHSWKPWKPKENSPISYNTVFIFKTTVCPISLFLVYLPR